MTYHIVLKYIYKKWYLFNNSNIIVNKCYMWDNDNTSYMCLRESKIKFV